MNARWTRPILFACVILITSSHCIAAARPQHVVIVSLDGLRADAVGPESTPVLWGMKTRGASFENVRTTHPSITMIAHASMLTGLDYPRHRITWNDDRPERIRVPTVFSVAHDAGFSTAAFYSKSKLHSLIDPRHVRTIRNAGQKNRPHDVARDFHRLWPGSLPALTFVHFLEPDETGHREGWKSRGYWRAVSDADQALGEVIETIRAAGRSDSTVIFVTSDHGGTGFSHSARHRGNYMIPLIVEGPGIRPGRYARRARVFDVAPTALAVIGLSFRGPIDGTVLRELVRK